MRKLLLFALLAAALGGGLFLEQHLTKAKTIPPRESDGDSVELLIGDDEPMRHASGRPPVPGPKTNQPPPPAAQPQPGPPKERVLGPDETLATVAQEAYGSELYAENLAQVNGLASADDAKPGLRLKLPLRNTLEKRYRVRKHDSLSGIAQKLLGSIKQGDRLAAWNHLEDKNALREGQVLRIPD